VDAQTQAAFDTLRQHVDRRLDRVDQRFDQVDGRFEQIDRRFEQIDRRFEQVDRRLDGLDRHAVVVDQRLDRLDETAVETRRHFHVVAEGLRGDIRLLAEGFTLRIDRLETILRDEIVRSHDALAGLIRLAYTDLDRRVTALEPRRGESD
jgi:archaellum component FlaC